MIIIEIKTNNDNNADDEGNKEGDDGNNEYCSNKDDHIENDDGNSDCIIFAARMSAASFVCYVCKKDLSSNSSLITHKKKYHGIVGGAKITCLVGECSGLQFSNVNDYRKHLDIVHHVPSMCECIKMTFNTRDGKKFYFSC